MTTTRNWIFGAFGAAVATAAVITGVVVAGNNNPEADDPGFSETPSGDVTNEPTADPTDPATSEPPTRDTTVPVYYVGDTPSGPRLYREFQQLTVCPNPGCAFSASVEQAVLGMPLDPDYRNPWPGGPTGVTASFNGDFITVDLETDDPQALHDGPAGITPDQADIAIQSLIYSAQAGLGQGRPGVQLLINGSHTDQILGQPASEPLANGNVTDTLSLMSITSPAEGATLSGKVKATGVNSGFEAWVGWQILKGDEVVKEGFGTAEGWGDRLYPWEVEVDVTDLAPGTYTFKAMNDDPSAGAEGNGPDVDTKTITIQ